MLLSWLRWLSRSVSRPRPDQGAAARRPRRLAGDARTEPRRDLARDRPHRQVGAERRELPVARAVRRPLGADRHGQPRLRAEPGRPRREPAGARHGARRRHRQGRSGSTSSTSSRATCRRIASAGRRRPPIPETGNIYALSGGAQVIALEPRRQAALGSIVRRGVRRLHHARRPHDVAARRRRSRHRQRRRLELGHVRRTARTASSRSTSGPATSSTCPTRAAARTTRRTPRRSSPRSTACGCSSRLGDGGDPRDQAADRRKGLELRRGQARDQHGRRRQGQHRHRVARRREPRGQRARPDRGDRRLADRRHQDDEVGQSRARSSASRLR